VSDICLQAANHAFRFGWCNDLQFSQHSANPNVQHALLLAMARRCLRDPSLAPLPPIRSLHYFLPVIEEVLSMEISPDYVRYLKRKLAPYLTPDLFSE